MKIRSKQIYVVIVIILTIPVVAAIMAYPYGHWGNSVSTDPIVKVAGFRSSDYGGPSNANKYGHGQIDPAYWTMVGQKMTAKFPGSSPGAQWVVGYVETPAISTFMPFPAPE